MVRQLWYVGLSLVEFLFVPLRQMWSFQFLLGKVSFNWAAMVGSHMIRKVLFVLGPLRQLCWGEENRIC